MLFAALPTSRDRIKGYVPPNLIRQFLLLYHPEARTSTGAKNGKDVFHPSRCDYFFLCVSFFTAGMLLTMISSVQIVRMMVIG